MKQIIHIALKDLKIEFTEKSTLIFFLILPLVFTAIIGLGLENLYGEDGNEDTRTPLVIVNQDDGKYGELFFSFMETSEVTRPILKNEEDALSLMEEEDIYAYAKIPENFSENINNRELSNIQFISSAQNRSAMGMEQDLKSRITRLNTLISLKNQNREILESANTPADQIQESNIKLEKTVIEQVNNPTIKAKTTQAETVQVQISTGFEQSSPGQLVTWVLTTLLGASEAFVYERNKGTLRRLLTSPTRKPVIIAGKILGRLVMGITQMVILIGFGALVLGVNWGRDYAALALILFTFALAGTALGVMLAAFSRTVSQAGGLTVLFSMTMAALGGAWWPLEITPKFYQDAVQILPSTWAMRGFNDVIIRGQGVEGILLESLVLVGFALLFFVIGIWKLKFE